MRVVLLYHFFAPATVVSAVHYAQLAEGLAAAGHDVEAWPSNRERRGSRRVLPSRSRAGRVAVRRCWRPGFSQDGALGRLVNTLWMWLHWCGRAITARGVDVVIVGTDPPMSVAMARVWRVVHPRVRIVHWSFDLYPDAAVLHGLLREGSLVERMMRAISANGRRACDAIVDSGPCMRARTARLAPDVRAETIVPWALSGSPEPRAPDPALRRALFGEVRSVLLYAGHLGHAHEAAPFLALARELADEGVVVAFQGIGEREPQVREAARGLSNVRFLAPCSDRELVARLEVADFHLVSLKDGWEGTVVPSKFFAALAVARPVIYAGPEASSVARWIGEFDLGVAIAGRPASSGAIESVRAAITRNERDRDGAHRCRAVERERFSQEAGIAGFCRLIDAVGSGDAGRA